MIRFTYPDRLEVRPFAGGKLAATVGVPGSKSITNRALVLAALTGSDTDCRLTGVLDSEDTRVMFDALLALGFAAEADCRSRSRLEAAVGIPTCLPS